MIKNIQLNQIKCKQCGDILTSKHTHDYKTCSCGSCSIDGGNEYLRRNFKEKNCYIERSIYELE